MLVIFSERLDTFLYNKINWQKNKKKPDEIREKSLGDKGFALVSSGTPNGGNAPRKNSIAKKASPIKETPRAGVPKAQVRKRESVANAKALQKRKRFPPIWWDVHYVKTSYLICIYVNVSWLQLNFIAFLPRKFKI